MTAKAGRPMRIHGVLITPKWDWSPDYEQYVRRVLSGRWYTYSCGESWERRKPRKVRTTNLNQYDVVRRYAKLIGDSLAGAIERIERQQAIVALNPAFVYTEDSP
ncbi:MAG: hypothetical protein ACREEP_11395 [Dongiaceae bacterium]